jgi:hypothetical protein
MVHHKWLEVVMSRSSRKAKRDVAKNLVVTEHIVKGRPLDKVLPLTGYKNTETLSRIKREVMEQARSETKSEMQLYRENQLARITEKWDEIENDQGMSGAEKHLAWSRWMKLEMDLRGTAAPTKSISANVNVDQQVIPIEQQLEYLNAFAGLYEDERLEELDRVKARKRTCRVVMDANVFQKALPESGS